MENEPVTKEQWYSAQRQQANEIKQLATEIRTMKVQVDQMYQIFMEGGFLFKFIKYTVYGATALLGLWALIKSAFLRP